MVRTNETIINFNSHSRDFSINFFPHYTGARIGLHVSPNIILGITTDKVKIVGVTITDAPTTLTPYRVIPSRTIELAPENKFVRRLSRYSVDTFTNQPLASNQEFLDEWVILNETKKANGR